MHAACSQRLGCCHEAGPKVAHFATFNTQVGGRALLGFRIVYLLVVTVAAKDWPEARSRGLGVSVLQGV